MQAQFHPGPAIDPSPGCDIGSRGLAKRSQRAFVELDLNAVQWSRGIEEFGTFHLRGCEKPRDEGAERKQLANEASIPMRTHGVGYSERTTTSALAIGRSLPSLG